LKHATRWTTNGDATPYPEAASLDRIEADTGQLGWYGAAEESGQVVVDSPRTQALIGFFDEDSRSTTNVTSKLDTPFASILLTSLDGRPIDGSQRMLLATTATSVHTGFEWNEDRKTVKQWGTFPTVIEPVRGEIALRGLKHADAIKCQPLTAEGRPLGDPQTSKVTDGQARLELGEPAATWYLLTVRR
jgi:hypothetical protein